MRKIKIELTQKEIKELFDYDKATGVFVRKQPAKGGIYAGSNEVRGTNNGYGYLRTQVKGKQVCLHLLAWVYVTGKSPSGFIDHIDRDRTNNRFSNLREVGWVENNCNRGLRKDSVTGYAGVGVENGRYKVRVQLNGKRAYFGSYQDLELAVLVAEEARDKYHKEYAYV